MKLFLVAGTAAILLMGCKKTTPGEAAPGIIAGAPDLTIQHWFNKASAGVGNTFHFADGMPRWKDLKFIPSTASVIVPVELSGKYFNNENLADKYLVIQRDRQGKITDGHYLYLLGKGAKPALDKQVLQGNPPLSFTGAVVRTDFEGHVLTSKHYEGGLATGRTDKFVQKKHKNNGSEPSSLAPLDPGCSYITIDWYWQTFVNGVLVSEEYLFSSQEIECLGGGGGGNSTGENVYAAAEAFINQGSATSILISNEMQEMPGGLRIVAKPNWKIYHAGTWGVFSYETIIWERAATNLAFSYASASSRGFSALGTSIGGTRDFSIVSKDYISTHPTRVLVDVDYTITHKPNAVLGVLINPVTLGHRTNKLFFPPVQIVMGN